MSDTNLENIEYDNIYCYKNTNVLKNNLNIKDNKLLEKAETQIVMVKLYMLYEKCRNTPYNEVEKELYTKKYFMQIHKFLFSDLFEFAGKIRTVNIAKGNFPFAVLQYIDIMLDETFSYLKSEFEKLNKKYNENFDEQNRKEEIVRILTKVLADLNVIHPFREGNGRATREYIRQIAYYNGYILDFTNFTEKEILDAMKLSVINTKELQEIIKGSLYKK